MDTNGYSSGSRYAVKDTVENNGEKYHILEKEESPRGILDPNVYKPCIDIITRHQLLCPMILIMSGWELVCLCLCKLKMAGARKSTVAVIGYQALGSPKIC